MPFISAIVLVANGSVARQTMNVRNVFTLLRGHMPDAVLTNTLGVLTNCYYSSRYICLNPSGLRTLLSLANPENNKLIWMRRCRNLDPKVLPMKIVKEHLFHMQNSAFSTDPSRSDSC